MSNSLSIRKVWLGKFSYRVTLVTNDPSNSVKTIELIGEIKK